MDMHNPAFHIDFETVTCLICDSSQSVPAGKTEWRGNTLSYVVCSSCGLKYMNPRPTQAWYIHFYATEFWEDKFARRSWRSGAKFNFLWKMFKGGVLGRIEKGRKRARQVVPEILKRVELGPTSKVLDVGCAFGLILDEIKTRTGAEVFGIEPNASARSEAERRTGIKFIGTSAEDIVSLKGHDGNFDLICFSNVLENIVDPRPILSSVSKLLSANGVLYVDTPNVFYYDAMNPYHPYIYSPDSIQRLLRLCGLQPFETVFETETTSKANLNQPFTVSRPRFVTVYAKAGAPVPQGKASVDTAALLERIALSGQRYNFLKRR